MNFVDYTLIRLADPATRAALFDADALEHMAQAAYGAEADALGGPFQPLFHELTIGVSVPARSTFQGYWGDGSSHNQAHFTLSGLGREPALHVDALWRGGIIARVTPANARVEEVVSSWPDPGSIDEEIVDDLGSLPTGPAVLEAERRARFLARVRAGLAQPAALTDAVFDEWLARTGVPSIGELMTRFRGVVATATLRVRYSPPAETPSLPRELPTTAAVLLRDAPISLASILAESKAILEHLREAGVERARDTELGRAPVLAVWLVPEVVFDDADWPGGTGATPAATRLLRRRAAAQWLGPEGIVFATTPVHP